MVNVMYVILTTWLNAAGTTIIRAGTKEDVGAVLGILQAIVRSLVGIVAFFVDKTIGAGIEADAAVVVFLLFVLTIWLWSACWAGSISRMRRHSPALHFAIGLLLPLVYPLVILFAMDVRGARGREKRIRDEEEVAADDDRIRKAVAASGTKGVPEEVEEELKQVFDYDFFKRISFDEDGNPTGPWLIKYGGNEVIAPTIADALPHAVVVEIHQGEEGRLQRIRVPYAKITACELMR